MNFQIVTNKRVIPCTIGEPIPQLGEGEWGIQATNRSGRKFSPEDLDWYLLHVAPLMRLG